MMKKRHMPLFKVLAGRILLPTLLLLGHALPVLAGEPQVLTVRPEKIEAVVGPKTASPPLGRDPFNWSREQINFFKSQEPREKSNSIGGLTLSGIIWDKNNPQAVINDRLVTKATSPTISITSARLKTGHHGPRLAQSITKP